MGKKERSKSPTPTTSPNMDSDSENKVHKRFHLDPQEKVLFVIKCRKKSRNGELVITEEHICFYSALLGSSKKKVLAFNQIANIENLEKDAGVKITTKNQKPITFHFKQNESVYLLIEGQWEQSGHQPSTRLSTSTTSTNSKHSPIISQKSIHKHFQLPESEFIVLELSCSLKGSTVKLKHYGKLFITQNYLCFYSSFLKSSTKRIVKLRNITTITKEKAKLILVQTTTESYKFSTFIDRDEAYDELLDLQEKAKLDTTSLPSTPNLNLSRSASFDGTSSGGKRNSIDVNQLQETLEYTKKQQQHSRQNSIDNNSNSTTTTTTTTTPTFKKVHSRQNSNNTTTTTPTTTTTITTTPKQHSRQNSNNTNTTPTISPIIPPTTTTTTTTPPPQVIVTNNNKSSNNNNNNNEKLGNRIDKVGNVIPIVVNNDKASKKSDTQETKIKYRACCFGIF